MLLRRIVLIASVSSGLAAFILASPAVALPGGSHARDVYRGPGSALWGNSQLSTPSTPLTLVNGNGATAALGGLVLDVTSTGKVTGGTALWVPPNSSIGQLAVFTSGSIGKGTATADGTVDGSRLKVALVMSGLSSASVNSRTTTIGSGTIDATIW
jgi:hypothetical protein